MTSRHRHTPAALVLTFLAACGPEQPSAPSAPPAEAPDLRAIAIPLTIEVATGRITVGSSGAQTSQAQSSRPRSL